MPTVPEPGRTALYRLYDEQDRLLYVGITGNPKARWQAHAHEKDWWPQVARKSVEWFESRESAERAEKAEILDKRPAYNLSHNPGRARELYNLENARRRAKEAEAAKEATEPRFWLGYIPGRPDLS